MLKAKRGFARGKSLFQAGFESRGWGFEIPRSPIPFRIKNNPGYYLFNSASLFLASSTSAILGSAFFQGKRNYS